MQPVSLFDLAAQQSRWLAVRQAAVAGNIANANTPGYGAAEVAPFDKVLDNTAVSLRATNNAHFGARAGGGMEVRQDDPRTAILPSENTVVLENELMKAGEVRHAFELNTAIVKAFHRMTLMAVKS